MARKSDKAEIERRISQVYRLLLSGYSTSSIEDYSRQQWGITRSCVATYIKRAREQMRKFTDTQREQALAEELELRRELIRRALESGKLAVALQIADSRARLRGLFDQSANNVVGQQIIQIITTPDTPEVQLSGNEQSVE